MLNQIRNLDIFTHRPDAITAKPLHIWRRRSLLAIAVLLVVPGWSASSAQAGSAYDQVFIRREFQDSAFELGLARLGRARALRPDVRAFAETLINDHAQYDETLRVLARSKDISLPPGMGRNARRQLDRLGSTAPRDFDTAFLREARRINGTSLRTFRLEASRTADPDIRAVVIRFLEVDKKHQSLARSLSTTLVASRSAVVHPPRTGDPIVVVPALGTSPMPIIDPPSDAQLPNRD